MYSQNFNVSLVSLIFFIPQSVVFTFFRTPILAISHLSKLWRIPEKFKKDLISFKTFFTEACFFKKNVVSAA